ncbi:MAG: sporulation initiation factor Spo0A C-terminal domain-containing protein [Oscillospiraceae bacterium]|nr:MAG: sporulation initiation factor Spo0A C-terminal domain-containing protein [Oscillospiraceae bacterium]
MCSGRERSLSQEAIAHRRTACAARLLEKSGIRHGRLGFRYAQCAIMEMTVQDGTEPMQNVYSRVALRFGTKANCVERSIRSAVEEAWTNGDVAQVNTAFGALWIKKGASPQIENFLRRFVKSLKLSMHSPSVANRFS